MALMYEKVLEFPLMRNQEYSSGSLINHLLIDVEKMSKILYHIPQLTQFPVFVIVGIYMIYTAVGFAFIGAFITILLIGFFISWIGTYNHK